MTTRIGGMASGIDTEAIIKSLLDAKQVPITRLEDEIAKDTEKQTAWSDLDTQITDLRSISSDLSSYLTWRQKNATATDSTIATATASNNAQVGSYSTTVTQLAQAQRIASDSQSSATTALSLTGDFTVEGQTITVTATDTLEDIRDNVNNAAYSMTDANRVKAYIIGTTLLFERENTGNTDITITDGTNNILQSGTGGLGIFDGTVASPTAVLKNEKVTSEDLAATINGIAVTDTKNTGVSSFVSGVSFNFLKAGTTTVEVTNDTASIKTLITDFIEKYNSTMSTASDYGEVLLNSSGDVSSSGLLQGDYLISSIQIQSRSYLTNKVTDPGRMDQNYNSLYTAGIWFDSQSNELSIIDEDQLDDMLANHFDELEDLFRDQQDGILKTFDSYLYSVIDPVDGSVTTKINNIQDSNAEKQNQVWNMKSDLVVYESELWEHFGNMETAVNDMKSQANYLLSSLGK